MFGHIYMMPKRLSYYFAGGATAGAIVKWFRQTMCQFEIEAEKKLAEKNAYDVLNEQAANIPVGSEGLIVLPYFMGERSPIWDSDAKRNNRWAFIGAYKGPYVPCIFFRSGCVFFKRCDGSDRRKISANISCLQVV
ncbi:hypothetical protein GCM10020331_097920 [Ectobacillus funiculus]